MYINMSVAVTIVQSRVLKPLWTRYGQFHDMDTHWVTSLYIFLINDDVEDRLLVQLVRIQQHNNKILHTVSQLIITFFFSGTIGELDM